MTLPLWDVSIFGIPHGPCFWHAEAMKRGKQAEELHLRLVDSLYTEAMLLADEARAYFDDVERKERDMLDPLGRVSFSCESLKVTTRLMHIIAWLLTQRAVAAGEIGAVEARSPARRLGLGPETSEEALLRMPPAASALIEASIDLHRRVARLDAADAGELAVESPARSMIARLAHAF